MPRQINQDVDKIFLKDESKRIKRPPSLPLPPPRTPSPPPPPPPPPASTGSGKKMNRKQYEEYLEKTVEKILKKKFK